MRKRTLTSRVAALSLFTVVGLVAALAIAWPNLARAHSPGGASLTALTVTSDGTPLPLTPTFSSTVHYYTIPVADTVTQITIKATPEGDGTVAYKNETGTTLTDADTNTDGMQVDIPTAGQRINVKVAHTDGTEVLEEYGVLVIRDGPAVPDLLVLMELYNSTDGANWKGNPNWGSTEPFEEWDALVTVNGDNERIQLLALDAQNLVGTIPASLNNLDKMKVLDLSFNKLTGPIPDLSGITNLTELALHENQLSGTIPASLGAITSLELLWLAKNRLTGPIPEELGNLIELEDLHLYGNALTGPIPDLSKLTGLLSLRLAGNQLTGPITGLSSLTDLEYLTLPNNQLSGEITGLSSLTGLVELKLFNNNLSGEIPDLSSITSLRWLSLAGNRFTGEIPASLGSHGPLRHLFLDRNQLDGTIPEELGSLRNLKTLNLGDNQLTGTIPEELGNLRNLEFLYLDNNQLSGPIPAELGRLGGLRVTRFAGNALTGCVPNGLRYLMNAPDVTMLDPEATDAEMLTLKAQDFIALGLPFCTLSSLTLSGVTLQQAFASDTVVYTASVAYTVESTTVTATLHNSNDTISIMKGMASYPSGAAVPLAVGPNEITIKVTTTDRTPTHTYTVTIFRAEVDQATLMALYNSTDGRRWTNRANWGSTEPLNTWYGVSTDTNGRVTELNLGGNNLVGTLPAALGNLDQMVNLQLWGNQLRGAIPASLGGLTNLQDLSFSNNHMSGSIPDLSDLTNLQKLYLQGNQLSGTIPASLGSITSLTHLYLNYNQLSGALPNSLGDLTSLQELVLSSNHLDGTIPDLSSLTSLWELSLDFNQLDGTIPTSLNSLTSLRQLTLNDNQLSGTIPTLSSLIGLELLLLHSNNLTGGIPASLNSLTSLIKLDLSHNQLSGTIPDLSGLVNLDLLSLRNNQLTGPIPAWLGQLTGLGILYLSLNQLSGDFPQELGNLTNLYFARFAGNPSLTGCVPLGLRELVTDERDHDFIALNLPFCMLSTLAFSDVTLTPTFASATTVYTAFVVNTVESTTVTPTLADSSDRFSIKKGRRSYPSGEAVPLAVGSNVITIKVIPSDSTPTLTYTVTIFREGVDRATLTALYNSAGGASWTDKTNWGSPTEPLNTWFGVKVDGNGNVTELALPDNNLSGPLPAELGSLTSLTTLDLSDNQLSGTIPDLSSLTQLQNLYLGDNQLSGTIPDWLGSLTGLQKLSLRDNRLTGTIPAELGNLFSLDLLYLDGNQLNGPIPAALGSLSGLQVTRFAGNALTGCVPNGLRYLVTAPEFESLPAHDFIAVDANDDGDTTDDGDTPGLGLPFCTLRSLTLSGVTLEPVFASDTVVYTAAAAHDVLDTFVQATTHNNNDTVSITKSADTYTSGNPVLLDVGSNVITIEVTPADGTPTHTYTVTVTRAPNTPPAFNEGLTTTRGVDENTTAGRDIGDPVRATDDDNDTLTYSLDATGAASFDIDESSGQLRTKADLDHETKSSYTVTVSVRDSLDSNGDADEATDDTIRVTIQVANVNEGPEFPSSETGMRSSYENTGAGMNIGTPVAATDDDDDDTLTYSLDVPSRATFAIDASSGQLRTNAALDYETQTTYTVTVTAADPSGLNDTIEVTITVNNVDEDGTVTLSSTQPIEGTLLTATLDDPDDVSGSVTWSWRSSPNRNLPWDPPQWGNRRLLYAGCRRCGPLPAGHRLLHRWRRVGQERTGRLDQ